MRPSRVAILLSAAFAGGALAGFHHDRPVPKPPPPWSADFTVTRSTNWQDRSTTVLTPTRAVIDGQKYFYMPDRPAPDGVVWELRLAGGHVTIWAIENRDP
ncbi:MAG TPA: hypothetical protein VKE40_17340 [Gemmataceae bacterium]|nr:hypothetical protein [Gemmataceae bacterium]